MCFPPLFGPHVCLPSFCSRALSFSSSLFAQVSLFLSLFLSFFLSFSFSVCCLSRHHCDVTVMLRCDMISLPLFWSPCVSHLFLQSTRSLSLSFTLSLLSLSLYFLSLFLSLSFSVCCLARHYCDTTVMVRCGMLTLCPSFCSRRALSLSLFLSLSLSFSLSLSLSFSLSSLFLSLSVGCAKSGNP